jgi:hypothetical protein
MTSDRSLDSKEQKQRISDYNGKFKLTNIYQAIRLCKRDVDISAINEVICDMCDDNLFQILSLINCTLYT